MHWAAGLNDHRMIGLLCRHHADVNVLTVAGETPLIIASREGNPMAVQVLLERFAKRQVSIMFGVQGFHVRVCVHTCVVCSV